MKPYSEDTATEIDEEVKNLVDECYNSTRDLLESKKELIESLAKELLEHESINLPQIMKILGDRPFPLKESIREYLEELEKRKVDEDRVKEMEAAEAAMEASEAEVDAAEDDKKAETVEKADEGEELVDAAKPLEDVADSKEESDKKEDDGKK